MEGTSKLWKTRLSLTGFLLLVPLVCSATQGASQAGDRRLEGVVVDQQGLPVPGAEIVVTQQGGGLRKTTVSSLDRFLVDELVPAIYEVRVAAAGFDLKIETVDLQSAPLATLEIRLEAGSVTEQVIVTATRSEQRLGDVPASVTVLDGEEIRQSPAIVADDILRQSPTFSLFRRTSSLSSHPTSQGVSLRGIGPSGTSRTLVLIDDIPFNDPFGGWVYWTRVPLMSVDRMELVNGSTSSLYGNYAMGGVINIATSPPARRTFEIRSHYGNKESPKVDFFGSDQWNKLGVVVEGSVFDTDGYPVVAESERGPIDTNATVTYQNVSAKLQFTPSDRMTAFVRGGYFSEDRINAKVGEVNDTEWTVVNGGVQFRMPDESNLEARLFVDDQVFHSTFLAVSSRTVPRDTVRLTTDQRVPADGVGSLVQWSKSIGLSHVFSAGTDWRWVDGDSEEDLYNAAVPASYVGVTQQAVLATKRVSGGAQQSIGAFVQDIFTPVPKLAVTLSARVDHWRSYDGHNLETSVATGLPTANNNPSLPEKSDNVVSPRVAAIYHVTERVSAWGDYGLGFRAPTLNELYRQFSLGGTTTRPNNQLGPERLKGGELGINVAPARNVTIRATWFDNRVKDSVGNVTISANVQQRQNLGRTHVWGIQTDGEYRLSSSWRVSGGYLYDQATVTENASNPALVGKFLPQVPQHRGSWQVAYANRRYATVSVGMQVVGRQFDDDLNARTVPPAALAEAGYAASTKPGLPMYAVFDLFASRALGSNTEVFFGAQNLFDQQFFVQTNPSTFGTPRLVHGGCG